MLVKMDTCKCGRKKRAKFKMCDGCFRTKIHVEPTINGFNFNALMKSVQYNCIGTTDGHRITFAGKLGDVS